MTALAAQPYAGEAALLMVVIWAVAASLVPFLRLRWRATAFWAVVALGVPALGWMTFVWGPGPGVLALVLGLSILVWQPLDALRRRREATARAHSVARPMAGTAPPTAAE